MDKIRFLRVLTAAVLVLLSGNDGRLAEATVVNIINKCGQTVWPGILSAGNGGGGFALEPQESKTLSLPGKWSGRIWGRTGCKFDASGRGFCQTGDCGKVLNCNAGAGGNPPVSLLEFTFTDTHLDFYDVSLVDGYNLPVSISAVPKNGKATGTNCTTAGNCNGDLRENCPPELALKVDGNVVACRSACEAFGTPEYCCTGAHNSPKTCHPFAYSQLFKKFCPTAYSYAYDDPSSLFTCASGADYTITFCPTSTSTPPPLPRLTPPPLLPPPPPPPLLPPPPPTTTPPPPPLKAISSSAFAHAWSDSILRSFLELFICCLHGYLLFL